MKRAQKKASRSPDAMKRRIADIKTRRAQKDAAFRRRVAQGAVPGAHLTETGVIIVRQPKGYVPYSTRELKTRVLETMDRWEAHHGERRCPINGRHQLQIRGKDLRRLLKIMPGTRQEGRALVQSPNS